jgi:hypothetical protein
MAGLRFTDIAERPSEVLDFTSLTVEEFRLLVEPFETAFQAYMAEWRLDGKQRTARRYTTYTNCPLPRPEDRLLFILTFLKTNPLQTVHGRMFGMRQNKANQWLHVLLPVLRDTFATLGDLPRRTLTALAARLGMPVDVLQTEWEEEPVAHAGEPARPSPLFVTTVRNDPSRAPTTRTNRKAIIAARKSATPSRTCS